MEHLPGKGGGIRPIQNTTSRHATNSRKARGDTLQGTDRRAHGRHVERQRRKKRGERSRKRRHQAGKRQRRRPKLRADLPQGPVKRPSQEESAEWHDKQQMLLLRGSTAWEEGWKTHQHSPRQEGTLPSTGENLRHMRHKRTPKKDVPQPKQSETEWRKTNPKGNGGRHHPEKELRGMARG